MAGWATLPELIREELIQREQEGCAVDELRAPIEATTTDEARLAQLYDALMALPTRDDFPYIEPNDLQSIRAERPAGPRRLPAMLSEAQWRDKFLGAWLGRCAGCALGKPLETEVFMRGAVGNPGWKNIQLWFEGADTWPIDGYVPGHSRASDTHGLALDPGCHACEREHIQFMQSDDDIRYTVLGLLLLEEHGLDFDTWDVGKLWHKHLTYQQVCTAETQAYLNFAHASAHLDKTRATNRLDWVRLHRNPYREWIGAQIRVDALAYAAAGQPELAAELAWRDASFSHVKNGVYGAMFVAAMIAAAFVEEAVESIVAIGLSEIPQRSRLAQAIRQAIDIAHAAQSQLELVKHLWSAFGHYDAVHTINNAALVAATLVWAQDDFERAITTAVLGGWDTDCNGATVGSIMGARLGATALPREWIAPLNDTLYAEVIGFHPIAISECARRSCDVFARLHNPVSLAGR